MNWRFIAVLFVSLVVLQVRTGFAGTGRLEGEVIDADSRAPIRGARVRVGLVRDVPNGVFVSSHSKEVITDERGHFAFAGIPPGHCQIVVEKNGYAWPPDGSEVRQFHVVSGHTISGVEIALKKAATVAGRIVDSRGEPVVRTVVRALKFMVRAHAVEIAAAQTNEVGDFRFDSLSQGAYLIAATRRSAAPSSDSYQSNTSSFVPTYYPGTADREAAQIVFVRSGETVTGVQFSLLSAPAFQVSGIVIDATGHPVAGALVMLMPHQHAPFGRMIERAAADGTFQIGGVVAGRYRVSASARSVEIDDGFGGIFLAPIRDGRSVPVEPINMVVDGSDVAGVRIVLPTGQ